MRDLICGGCDGDVCDMGNSLPPGFDGAADCVSHWPALCRSRQSATPLPRLQPENIRYFAWLAAPRGRTRKRWLPPLRIEPLQRNAYQGLFRAEAISHCRNARNFGASVTPSGDTM